MGNNHIICGVYIFDVCVRFVPVISLLIVFWNGIEWNSRKLANNSILDDMIGLGMVQIGK